MYNICLIVIFKHGKNVKKTRFFNIWINVFQIKKKKRLYETLQLRKAIFSPEMVRKAVPLST